MLVPYCTAPKSAALKARAISSFFCKQAALFLFVSGLLVSGQVKAQETPCTNDSLKIETNDTQWQVVDNNFGAANNVNAKIITSQYNSIPGYNASWISYKTDWLQYTTLSGSNDDSFMVLRYTFKNCGSDTVRFRFQVNRDNYCNVTLDGNIMLMQDAPATNSANYAGSQVDTSIFLDTCTHHLDFKVFNRADFNGGNGFGLLVGGWLTAKHNTLFTNAAGCEGYACCRPNAGIIHNSVKEEISVYPNPASETISIVSAQTPATDRHYTLQNYLGQTVMNGRLNRSNSKTEVDISNLVNGIYLLKIDGYRNAIKILKQ